MSERISTVVIGAGQAGLATSYHLSQHHEEHTVLEKGSTLASAWRRRWDSFTLVTPNWALRLPGFPYAGDDPDGFLSREEVIEYIEAFAATFDPPVRFGVGVTSVAPAADGNGYRVHTDDNTLEADNVVVATGTFQTPRIPAFSSAVPDTVTQLHTSGYRNPASVPEGAVLVVGTGQSGCQIAEELYESGRQVYLSASKVRRLPRRYRGKDTMRWLFEAGFFEQTVDKLPSPRARFAANPQASGRDGGHSLNLHQFARDGVVLMGHMEAAEGSSVRFAPDLRECVAFADEAAAEFTKIIDKFIDETGVDAPPPLDGHRPTDGYDAPVIRDLDLQAEGISTIVWATGYSYDFGWVELPLLDEYHYPIQQRGVTAYPGLYFVGLHWLHTLLSGTFAGVDADAAHVVGHLVRHRAATR